MANPEILMVSGFFFDASIYSVDREAVHAK
mgnify:CR=1 FL=1